jgi:peptide/nickel transport system substrate-binding protein
VAESNYWQAIWSTRSSRRRALIGGAGLAGAAAVLAACGDSEDSNSSVRESSGRVFTSTDPEGPVKRGGIWPQAATEPTNFDAFAQATAVVPQNLSGYIQSRLLKYKTEPGLDPNLFTLQPDLAESYEVSGDGLTYTFKLRRNVKFHNVAPVAGRAFDAQDVVATYKRFEAQSPNFSAGFKGLVENVAAPDNNTVVFQTSRRVANFLNLLAQAQYLLIFPREAGETYDPKRTIIGTGPWMMSAYTPSSGMEFARNPEYYEPGLPYMDGVNTVFLSETAAILAQFAAGNLHAYPSGGGGTTQILYGDFKDLIDRIPDLRVLKVNEANRPGSVSFGRGDNPQYFKDERVRKAVSLSIDRDAIITAIAQVEEFKQLGLDKTYHLQNFMPYAFAKWWVDPRGKEMGESAQWFSYDPAKAKQLLSAAGYPNGFDTEWHFDNRSGVTPNDTVAVLAQAASDVGIRAQLAIDDYNTVFQPKTQVGLNTGLLNSVWITNSDPSGYLSLLFGPGSNRNKLDINDAKFNQMYEAQNQEMDDQRRRSQLIDIYKYLADNMWEVPFNTNTDSYVLAYPFVKNVNAYQDAVGDFGAGSGGIIYRWLDKA